MPSSKKTDFQKRVLACLNSEAECQKFFEALEELSKRHRRAWRWNPGRSGAEEQLRTEFGDGESIPWSEAGSFLSEESFLKLQKTPWMGTGAVYIQEPGAMEAVSFLDPKPGELCLDLCAAPGGKSTQILEALGGRGRLVCNEVVRARASRLDALVARHGYSNVDILSLDPSEMARLYPKTFDAVLVDAPCSGESLFAKRNEKRSDVSDGEVRGCARRQAGILTNALAMLVPGGRCVYSTCAYSLEENENLVRGVLAENSGFRLVRESRRWPHRDAVPGGYAALIESELPFEADRLRDFHPEAHGLIRSGFVSWDGTVDAYAQSMVQESSAEMRAYAADDREAIRYLHGESLTLLEALTPGPIRVEWRGFPLGPGKVVEMRINNALPKILRSI